MNDIVTYACAVLFRKTIIGCEIEVEKINRRLYNAMEMGC